LFPGFDLETLVASSQSGTSVAKSEKAATKSTKKALLETEETRDETSAPESLPLEADGFDWTETAFRFSDISDGMAALSINPEGAGYLGQPSIPVFT
jgi:transcriptional regulatory protein GAL4